MNYAGFSPKQRRVLTWWTGLQLENTATGLRQIRQGVAKSRSFMTLV